MTHGRADDVGVVLPMTSSVGGRSMACRQHLFRATHPVVLSIATLRNSRESLNRENRIF
jgi:hypothetical protein